MFMRMLGYAFIALVFTIVGVVLVKTGLYDSFISLITA